MRRAVAALAGAATTALVLRAWFAADRTSNQTWQRTNYRDQTVTLGGGVAAAAGAAASALGSGSVRQGSATVFATGAAAAFGLIDDRDATPGAARGLRGHLQALARGQITTGTVKLLGIPAASLVAAGILTQGGRRAGQSGESTLRRGADVLSSGALIAGTANLINLFDLRPGRAVKVVGAIGLGLTLVPGPPGRLGAGACGVVVGAWQDDLGERTLLGDTGANALGALVGTGLALLPSAGARAGALATVVTLIVLSEKVSFSAVIDANPVLRAADAWGRRP